ncbi:MULTISPECIES: MmgE/PrpD family protein [unclassified Rhodococcus (in: high G+C Gram-positive bacteria)]|uniref:MmgE/PrpD family protein n=1 Tax=unclassified Rhodococcus (in: high G+C Gram-positive bacteria) TaxID=192944 RepID=UPI001143B10F|nr:MULTISPECIES: MmgE/PrpD family protein [unclassified Rhodococcus (in: high G+C Gram-positive bacteria)]TQC35975.1 MmgE/PrpD family protein [Rhodococcus sp. WS7]
MFNEFIEKGNQMTNAKTAKEEIGLTLARHICTTDFSDLTAEAVRSAKYSTLDTIGVILGASGLMKAMPGVVGLVRDSGGKPESTLIGYGGKVPAVDAAFVNGAMAHGLDFDDSLPEGQHATSPLIPALFAAAQRKGGVSGQEFITALALGQDLFVRLRKSLTWKQDWLLGPVLGTFAAAAACAKLLGLQQNQIVDAFGIATCQSAGTMQMAYGTGGDLRGMYAGFAAKAGLFSALLAEAGVEGTTEPFEGEAGFFEVYFDRQWDRATMLEGLGTHFEGSTIIYKLWPSCANTHGYIDTALRLMGSPGRTEEIDKVEVFGGDFAKRLTEPVALRRRPPTANDAKFSLPYTVALGLVRGTVGVGDFSEERRRDPQVTAMADKIEFVDDPQYNWAGSALPSGAVRITLRNGETLFAEAPHDQAPGGAKRPLSWSDLVTKFDDCASHAVKEISPQSRGQVIEAIENLDQLPDVSVVVEFTG